MNIHLEVGPFRCTWRLGLDLVESSWGANGIVPPLMKSGIVTLEVHLAPIRPKFFQP